MRQFSYTASYANCMHNFIVMGIPSGEAKDSLVKSFTCIIRNILQRDKTIKPSEYLKTTLGELGDISTPLSLVRMDGRLPAWEMTIKGADTGYNPAKDFFYDDGLWEKYLNAYAWVRQLLIPEAALSAVLGSFSLGINDQNVDFYLPPANLVIEIDGAQHQSDQKQIQLDMQRDRLLEGKNIRVVRIPVSALKYRNETFESCIREIVDALDQSASIQIIKKQKDDENTKRRMLYECVIRYEFLLLALIENGALSLKDSVWSFNIAKSHQKLFQIALNDLELWYQHLYNLRGMKAQFPKTQYGEGKGYLPIRNQLYSRPDEKEIRVPTVFNSYWDNTNFYCISCAEPVDYRISWPQAETDSQAEALLFFLRNCFGFDSFNSGQWQILANILCRRKTIGILPTGGGKSLCYQLAAALQPGITYVVCPINSLQIDQKRNLDKAGFKRTAYITSQQEGKQKGSIINDLSNGKYQIVWISPERLQSRSFRNAVLEISQHLTTSYAVIDEVHCLSEWGHDFRTSYLTLVGTIESICPQATLLGLTATASQAVLEDLRVEFQIGGESIRALPSLERENLNFEVINTEQSEEDLYSILREHGYGKTGEDGQNGIVFTLTRDRSDDKTSYGRNFLARKMRKQFPENAKKIAAYHAEVYNKVQIQNDFLDGKITLLSSTKAFGMGVNKEDLRFTVHYELPWSTEAFYQEAGRAGRDNKPADCYILFAPQSFGQQTYVEEAFQQSTTPERIKTMVSSHLLQGDLSTIFFLWGGNNKGVQTDCDMVRELLMRINQTEPTIDQGKECYTLKADSEEKSDENALHPQNLTKSRLELALYRLKLLGVVSDWMVDWRGYDTTFFDVYLEDEISAQTLEDHLIAYYSKYNSSIDLVDTPCSSPWMYPETDLLSIVLYYAEKLIAWTYDHIIYSRRQATYNILNFCRNYKDPESFRRQIDNFLRISEETIVLNGILENKDLWILWFQIFYTENTDEQWNKSKEFLDLNGIEQLRLSSARYRESFQDVVGLNLVYTVSGAISGLADLRTEYTLLDDCMREIETRFSADRDAIWSELLTVLSHYKSNISDDDRAILGKCLVNAYPERAREVYTCLEDPGSLSIIINEATVQICKALERIR